jgi:hypothetical protein
MELLEPGLGSGVAVPLEESDCSRSYKMRKILISLAFAAVPAMVLSATSASALECYSRATDPLVQDCYYDSGAFAYSTGAPSTSVYVGPRVYGDDLRFYRAPVAPLVRPGGCGTMHYWSYELGRCVDARVK